MVNGGAGRKVYRGDKFTPREASDDIKSVLGVTAPDAADLLALQIALLVHHLVACRNETSPSTPFTPVRASGNLVLQTDGDAQGFKATLKNSTVTDEVVMRNLMRRRAVICRTIMFIATRLGLDVTDFRGSKTLEEAD